MSAYAKYLSIAKVEMSNSFSSVSSALIRNVVIVVVLFIFYNLWSTIYGHSSTLVISGFTLVGILWYLVMSESVVSGSQGHTVSYRLSDDIKSGNIAPALSKPYNFVMYCFWSTIGSAVARTGIALVLGSALIWFLVGPPQISITELPFVFVSVVLALILQFLLYFSISILGFWFEDTIAFKWITDKMIFILGGMLIPLSFFPQWLQTIAEILPYSYMSYAPSYMFVNFTMSSFISTVALQSAWIIALGVIAFGLFELGARRVSINGG